MTAPDPRPPTAWARSVSIVPLKTNFPLPQAISTGCFPFLTAANNLRPTSYLRIGSQKRLMNCACFFGSMLPSLRNEIADLPSRCSVVVTSASIKLIWLVGGSPSSYVPNEGQRSYLRPPVVHELNDGFA